MAQHNISFSPSGTAHCLWTEAVPLHEIGHLELERASLVEFNEATQKWEVQLISHPGFVAFTNSSRETCLQWERETINALL